MQARRPLTLFASFTPQTRLDMDTHREHLSRACRPHRPQCRRGHGRALDATLFALDIFCHTTITILSFAATSLSYHPEIGYATCSIYYAHFHLRTTAPISLISRTQNTCRRPADVYCKGPCYWRSEASRIGYLYRATAKSSQACDIVHSEICLKCLSPHVVCVSRATFSQDADFHNVMAFFSTTPSRRWTI